MIVQTEMKIQKLSSELVEAVASLPRGSHMINSGQYGLNLVHSHISKLPAGSRVLEIGPGACLVVSELAIRFPEIDFYAVDVFNEAFENFHTCAMSLSQTHNFQLLKGDICESLDFTNLDYDFIYSIDVIEHSKSPRAFLKNAYRLLKPNGNIYISFPNYHFPFDSHFLIPIIINPGITESLFSKRIEQRERDYPGLWNTINFIKLNNVIEWIEFDLRVNFEVTTDPLDYFFQLACNDRAVRKRHPIISAILRILVGTRVHDLFKLVMGIKYSPFVTVRFSAGKSEHGDLAGEKIPRA